MPTESQAVALLQELGLTEYEARCFVALSRVSKASASEIATLSDVPRSRVYDAVDRLHRRGLVDVQQSEPREYRAISRETAIDTLRERHESTLEAAADALSRLRRTEELEEEGVWAIADHDHVTERIGTFLDDARAEVYVLAADESTLDQQSLDRLATVDDDVTTRIEVSSEELGDRVRDALPEASVYVTELAADPATLEGKRMGRIVMVDRRSVLLSAMSDGSQPWQTEETAIWASGPDHGLVVGLRHVLGSRMDLESLVE